MNDEVGLKLLEALNNINKNLEKINETLNDNLEDISKHTTDVRDAIGGLPQ